MSSGPSTHIRRCLPVVTSVSTRSRRSLIDVDDGEEGSEEGSEEHGEVRSCCYIGKVVVREKERLCLNANCRVHVLSQSFSVSAELGHLG